MTRFARSSGILLHPTSLPGNYGIGDLGDAAYNFVDWLEAHGQSIWQVLPLGPTSYGDSPYQTLSAFAGNPNLISLDYLVRDGLLWERDLIDVPPFPRNRVDFGWIIPYHNQKLALAHRNFQASATGTAAAGIRSICPGASALAGGLCPFHRAEKAAQTASLERMGR